MRREVTAVIASLMREVPDFPEPGIQFKDLTPLLADAHGLAAVTDALAELAEGADLVAGIDARGFLLGGAVANRLGIGVLAVRKGGKLPPPVLQRDLRAGIRHAPRWKFPPTASIWPGARRRHRRRAGHRRHPGRHRHGCSGRPARTSPAPRWCSNSPPSAGATCSNRCRSAACTPSEAISSKSG